MIGETIRLAWLYFSDWLWGRSLPAMLTKTDQEWGAMYDEAQK